MTVMPVFKSVHIDLEKGIYELNGQRMRGVKKIELEMAPGDWRLCLAINPYTASAHQADKEEEK